MRKLLLLLSITMLSATSYAQSVVSFTNKAKADSNALHVSFGLRAGISSANFSFTDQYGGSNSTDSYTSFVGGGLVNFEFKNFIIQTGILYNVKGGENNGAAGDHKTILKYVEAPVNFFINYPRVLIGYYSVQVYITVMAFRAELL